MKKIIGIFLILCIFPAMPVKAAIGETVGYVADVFQDIVHIVGDPLTPHGLESAIVRLGTAPIYDLTTGFRADAKSIMPGMEIRMAYHACAYANTEPYPAVVVWLNWDKPNAAVFTVTVSENIYRDSGGTVFLSADGKYRVSLSGDTIIKDPHYGAVSHTDIYPGMEFFVWVDMITASQPALVYPDKVVLVR